MFFFSSRRRHTRYIGDWSSDVCSSDLSCSPISRAVRPSTVRSATCRSRALRSEERRVGKECRSRGAPNQSKIKEGGRGNVLGVAREKNKRMQKRSITYCRKNA